MQIELNQIKADDAKKCGLFWVVLELMSTQIDTRAMLITKNTTFLLL